jgi:hypothetical protein
VSVIDIRNGDVQSITKIVFSGNGENFVCATSLDLRDEHFRIFDEESRNSVVIESEEQTKNLIKALQKTLDLGWLK